MREEEAPAAFQQPSSGPTELPLRILTGSEVVGEGGALQPLTSLPQQPGLVLSGQLVPPQGSAAAASQPGPSITTAPLVDWVVEQSPVPGQPLAVWAVSPHAWYRLLQPSARYAALFEAAKQAAAAQVEARMTAAQRQGGAGKRGSGGAAAGRSKRAKVSHGAGKVRFAGASGLAAASMADLAAFAGEWDAVSDEDMPDDFQLSDAEADLLEGNNLGKARRKAWQKTKYWQRRTAEEERQRAEAEARAAAEAAADVQRGPPPALTSGFRVPSACVADMLMVWEFTQAFSDVLQLPPYSLAALEAAICPGPSLPRRAVPGTPGPAAEGPAEHAANWMRHLASEDFIVDEPLLKPRRSQQSEGAEQPLRFRVSLGSDAKPAAAPVVKLKPKGSERTERLQQKYGLAPEAARRLVPMDRDYAPSGVLLRDICCALLRVAAGRATAAAAAAAGEQPRAAKLQSEENENPLPWPERVCNAVWMSAESDLDDRTVAIKLGYGDWQDLTAEERVRVLAALVRLALASEQMQSELSSRIEALAAARRGKDGKDAGGPGDEDSDGEGDVQRLPHLAASGQATPSMSAQAAAAGAAGSEVPSRAGSEAPSSSAAAARSAEQQQSAEPPARAVGAADWAAWLQQRRLGLRRPLGLDLRGRRYWCFGRQAGAFRVYVEDNEGQSWGWYEGDQLTKLRSWVEQASIAVEAPLLRALRTMPLPRSSARHQRPLGGSELEALRSDGYRTLVAPFLRGEWNTSKTGLLAPAEQRILLAVDALLGAVPLWFKGPEALQQHLAICEAAQSGNVADMGRALLSAEQLLAGEGRLSEEWRDVWQLPWSRAVSGCGDVRDMLLYAAALQQHVQAAPDLLPRQAFLKYAIEAQCPLFFPYPGENVAVMRAGLLRHIDRYMQLLGLAQGPQPQVPAEITQQEDEEGEPAKMELSAGEGGEAEGGEQAVKMEVDGEQQHQRQHQQQVQYHQQQQAGNAAGQAPAQPAAAAAPPPSDVLSAFGIAGAQAGALPAPSSQTGPSQTGTGSEAEGGSMEEGEEDAGSHDRQQPQQPAAMPPHGAVQLAPRVQEDKKAALLAHWEELRQRAQLLRPVERFIVRSVVYRRHLSDDADLEHSEADEMARRWPVAWLILRPAKYGPRHQLPAQDLIIPVAIDNTQPEYVIKAETYAERMRVRWQPGDRFRMFFGGQVSRKTHKRVKTGGVWYKGTVVDLKQAQPGKEAPLEEKERYDPWESLVVHWDRALPDENETVSPWELEIDPDEERRRAEEARRQVQAAARAQRARQSSRRSAPEGEASEATEGRAEMLVRQAERAQQLLSYHLQPGAEEEQEFNEAVYGQPLQLQQHLVQPALPAATPPVQQEQQRRQHGHAPSSGPAGQIQPLNPGQEVPPEVLDMLRPLTSDAFLVMLTNFYRGLKGKFKVPTFAHKELDLYSAFWAVMERGGYETVTAGKQWKEICRCLPGVDLRGQTSASYNMRLNYERCLLDFESYLACGQYERDLAAGCAPESEFLTDPARTRFTLPGIDYSTPAPTGRGAAKPSSSQGSDLLAGGGRPQRTTRGSSRLKQKGAPATEASVSQEDMLAMIAAAFPMPPAGDEGAAGLPVLPVVDAAGGQAWPLPGVPGAEGAAGAAAFGGTWEGILPPGNVGQMLKALGQLAVGRMVERFWADEGGWWPALISDFNAETGEHQLTYNAKQEDETFEWADLGELSNEDIRDAAASAAMPRLEDLPPLPLALEGWQPPADAAAAAAAGAGEAGAADGGSAGGGLAAPAAEPVLPVIAGGDAAAAAAMAAAAAASLPVGGFMGLLADLQPEAAAPAEQQEQMPAAGGGGSEQPPLAQAGEQDAQATLTVEELQAMLPPPPPLPPEEQALEEAAAGPAEQQQAGQAPAKEAASE
ncbi:hypothetical protein ABPG75_001204 [Micractinium tetrahymenae]